jgi:hypothetical protein
MLNGMENSDGNPLINLPIISQHPPMTQQQSIPNTQQTNDQNGYDVLGFNINSLGTLAPISIVMYCFNLKPQVTMMTLAMLLMYILTNKKPLLALPVRLPKGRDIFLSSALFLIK